MGHPLLLSEHKSLPYRVRDCVNFILEKKGDPIHTVAAKLLVIHIADLIAVFPYPIIPPLDKSNPLIYIFSLDFYFQVYSSA